ncbi:hypothetical protein GLOTRDRAFT_139979 [Gloeophyllum trabeum ATCC 11539]|uniref:PIPK domain-containing protein n=1 Tax=Gloeophyllum trabeum (strain ATCC 11539 / FP-39264 / Madison 617) TaxID=670483 RepID=S7RK75_GLOTA|nr:uncharacterized protein GLOTRDRAFT_139979 [Gloeophyllum trabeum ATCC 11539]EPQ53029.1 hypothetical protein GLOTRDRAFT_139979 [Gloeophyllum trabeum ATCC 11539]
MAAAAPSTSQKPLPAIPLRRSTRPLTTLTVSSGSHLRKFLHYALKEDAHLQQYEEAETRRELWVSTIMGALEDLGERMDRGGWLAGIRRAWKARRTRQAAQKKEKEKSEAEEKESKDGDDKAQDKNRSSRKQSKGTEKELPGTPEPSTSSHTQDGPSEDERRGRALKQLQELATQPILPRPKPSGKHLLLTLVPFGVRAALPTEDMGFDLVPSNIGCIFSADVFTLPSAESATDTNSGQVLYGLEEWDVEAYNPGEDQLRLVGGTFSFKGVTSPQEYASLRRILRLALFIYISVILEQHALADSYIRLQFPKPHLTSPTIPAPATGGTQVTRQPTLPSVPKRGHRYRESLPNTASGIWSFVSKKTENLLSRASSVRPHLNLVRHGSLDLPTTASEGEQLPPTSLDAHPVTRLRKFSFFGEDRASAPPKLQEPHRESLFTTTLEQLKLVRELLTTSPGIPLPPPHLLVILAEKEKQDRGRRLTGEERAGLNSLLLWEGKDPNGKGPKVLSGLSLFVRHQDFSTLYSEHVPSIVPLPDSRASSSSSQLSPPPSASSRKSSPSSGLPPPPHFSQCSGRHWMMYVYNNWDSASMGDRRLGETIEELVSSADEMCLKPGCIFKKGDHERRWIHNGTRVRVKVDADDSDPDRKDPPEEDVGMWLSCALCGRRTGKVRMSDGTYLLSFAKFLELLVYSPLICSPSPQICEHTTSPTISESLPESRLNIVRHFSYRSHVVSFSLSLIEEIYEVRLPRLQIIKGHGEKDDRRSIEPTRQGSLDEEKKTLRKEIKGWWQDVSDHMDKLEEAFSEGDNTLSHKSLPRLPSVDDAYDNDSLDSTPKAKQLPLPALPSSYSHSSPIRNSDGSASDTNLAVPRPPFLRSKTSISAIRQAHHAQQESDADCVQKLSNLRHTFQEAEQSLYAELLQTPTSSLNDVRRSFHSAARGAARRLAAWERKYQVSTVEGEPAAEKLSTNEPEWWATDCHAVPGGKVIVRENDWGSIIAFTLSSIDYKRELANLSVSKSPSGSHDSPQPTPQSHASSSGSSFFSSSGYGFFKSSSNLQPDPDDEGAVWHEPESHTATITRKEHPRDPAGILALPSVLRHKPADVATLSPSRLTNLVIQARSASSSERTPPSAYARPDVQLNTQAVDGEVSGLPEAAQVVGKILHDADTAAAESPTRSLSDSVNSKSSSFVQTHIRRAEAASLESNGSDSTVGPEDHSGREHALVPPPPPPKDTPDAKTTSRISSPSADSGNAPATATSPKPGSSSFLTSTLTSGLASAMRLVLNSSDTIKPSQSAASQKTHHALLHIDSLPIDERPHIKYDWTIGSRLKFSCTVYYARQFDGLRKRCGVEDIFLKSLERSANWAAEGGKSKSNFWKTKDDRFIIKTLVNAWNVADLQVLIELAPSYFRYMDSTATKPTALAKLLGFYTVEVRNLENGTTQAKADLLVMENLFYDQDISKTFDLKGIHGRKVKPSSNSSGSHSSKTLFDGEWIEGQQRALILLRPYSKVILQEAIRNDSDFLSKSSIMDYSLLLGLDEGRKQIVCGLVDMIGSYTFAKTLEYKVKQGLNPSGKEVTVMPPNEYQERFVNAMDSYFLACPDKWSRPWDEAKTKLPTDVGDLRCPL